MKHICKILPVIVLLAVNFTCLGDEPNNAINSDNNSIDARLISLESRISELEDRIAQLESRRPRPALQDPNAAADPVRDALRIERAKKQIQDANNAISLTERQLKSIPHHQNPDLQDRINLLLDKVDLLKDIEANYQKIIRCIEKNPDLGIDITAMKNKLIECQGAKKTNELQISDMKEQFKQTHKVFIRSKATN